MTHPALADVIAGRESWEDAAADANRALAHLVQSIELDGVAAETVTAPGASGDDQLVIHFHGGGYNSGSPRTHRALAARLSTIVDMPVVLVDYRLAPEHPCPAAVVDAIAAYRCIVARGVSPPRIAVGGDSSGGGLAMVMLTRLRAEGLPAPASAYLMSPWLDLTLSGESVVTNGNRDTMIGSDGLRGAAELYLQGRPTDDPIASPLFADLAGLPPLFVQAGSEELLLDDARRLVDRATAAGVEAVLDVWDGMQHVFQANPDVPQADHAIGRIAEFLTARLRPTL